MDTRRIAREFRTTKTSPVARSTGHDADVLSSFTTKFGKYASDLFVTGDASVCSSLQSAIDPGQFLRRRPIHIAVDAGIKFERQFGQFVLDLRRPCLDSREGFGELLGFSGGESSTTE